ncbi:hypothetical protein CRUP_004118 [Coryphaenoides rupestris]|nr:hypothetical protein CRUP_004118 [Coryphaenoides rupestris]
MLFHDQCAIYPVGFCSTRVFASMKNPEQQCLYTCQIKDGGAGPQFEIVPEEDPQNAIAASSALMCHSNLLKAIAAVSYQWVRFEVCRPGDGHVTQSLSEDDASVNFEAYQRHQGFDDNGKADHHTAVQTPQSPGTLHHPNYSTKPSSASFFNS